MRKKFLVRGELDESMSIPVLAESSSDLGDSQPVISYSIKESPYLFLGLLLHLGFSKERFPKDMLQYPWKRSILDIDDLGDYSPDYR